MNSMMDMLVTNFYVLMVGQIEILKQDFKLLIETDVDSIQNFKYSKGVKNNDMKVDVIHDEKHHFSSGELEQKFYDTTNKIPEKDLFEKTLHDRLIRCTKRYDAIVKYDNIKS